MKIYKVSVVSVFQYLTPSRDIITQSHFNNYHQICTRLGIHYWQYAFNRVCLQKSSVATAQIEYHVVQTRSCFLCCYAVPVLYENPAMHERAVEYAQNFETVSRYDSELMVPFSEWEGLQKNNFSTKKRFLHSKHDKDKKTWWIWEVQEEPKMLFLLTPVSQVYQLLAGE